MEALDDGEDEKTYATYKASMVREIHPEICGHPDPLVETASLGSVSLPKPNYAHGLHEDIVAKRLSDAQLETVIYANMRYAMPERPRPGFFLGDGAGVGKGRQIAALIKQHWIEGGRRILWISVTPDLKFDARRDLDDIAASHIPIYDGTGIPSFDWDGVCFITYALLRVGLPSSKPKKRKGVPHEMDGPQAAPNGEMVIPDGSRLRQIIDWMKICAEGSFVVFDESHKAKNLIPTAGGEPTQTGKAVQALQQHLPDAKVLYSSATGASEPRNLAYMERLAVSMEGNKMPFMEAIMMMQQQKLGNFVELAAMSLKASGAYLCRTLSYDGAEFQLTKIKIDAPFRMMYDRSCMVWEVVFKVANGMGKGRRKASVYWGAHQRFFRSMLMAGKVPAISRMSLEAMEKGMAVVIGLQSTGEAGTEQQKSRNEVFDDLISAPRMALSSYIQNNLVDDEDGNNGSLGALHKEVWELTKKFKNMISVKEVSLDLEENPELLEHQGSMLKVDSASQLRKLQQEIESLRNDMRKATMERSSLNIRAIHNKSQLAKNIDDDGLKQEGKRIQEQIKAHEEKIKNMTELLVDKQRSKMTLEANKATTTVKCATIQKFPQYTVSTANKPLRNIPDEYRPPVISGDGFDEYMESNAYIKEIRKWLLALAEHLELPANPLDSLIENLGGDKNVAELTGRRGYVIKNDDGVAEYRQRAEEMNCRQKDVNMEEKDAFMSGRKLVAIISDASSTGISLQADKRVRNQRRRCHITLELPWSADKAIQQFGRSHRSNQLSAPLYQLVVTPCGGEYRFASAASKRLASLGALLKGDRNALGAGSELKSFDIDNELGGRALKIFYESFYYGQLTSRGGGMKEAPKLPAHMLQNLDVPEPMPDASIHTKAQPFLKYFKIRMDGLGMMVNPNDPQARDMKRFLNRLLGLPLDEQELLFDYFFAVMECERQVMITEGTLDRGIIKVEATAKLNQRALVHRDERTGAIVEWISLSVDRGTSWDIALGMFQDITSLHQEFLSVNKINGFYKSKTVRYVNGKKIARAVILATVVMDENAMAGRIGSMKVKTYHPAIEVRQMWVRDLIDKTHWVKMEFQEAKEIWEAWHAYTANRCIHGDNCSQYVTMARF